MSTCLRSLVLFVFVATVLLLSNQGQVTRFALAQDDPTTATRTDREKLQDLRGQYKRLKDKYTTSQAENDDLVARVAQLEAQIAAMGGTPVPVQMATETSTPQPTATLAPTQTSVPTQAPKSTLTNEERIYFQTVLQQVSTVAQAMVDAGNFMRRYDIQVTYNDDLYLKLDSYFSIVRNTFNEVIMMSDKGLVPAIYIYFQDNYVGWMEYLNAAAVSYSTCALFGESNYCDEGSTYLAEAERRWTVIEPQIQAMQQKLND